VRLGDGSSPVFHFDKGLTVAEVKLEIAENNPTVFRGDIVLARKEFCGGGAVARDLADNEMVDAWHDGEIIKTIGTDSRMVRIVRPRGARDRPIAIQIALTVSQVLDLPDVCCDSIHKLSCTAQAPDGSTQILSRNLNFVDSVSRQATVHINEKPLIFVFKYESECIRSNIEDAHTFLDIQPIVKCLFPCLQYFTSRVEFIVNGVTISETDEPKRRISELYAQPMMSFLQSVFMEFTISWSSPFDVSVASDAPELMRRLRKLREEMSKWG
jgi:hypothetical protein